MTEESTVTGRTRGSTRSPTTPTLLMSDHPQELHSEKLLEGIEELAPGLVVLRKMGDIQALTRSHAVRQFGGGAMADVLTSGGEGAASGSAGTTSRSRSS